MIFFYIIWFCTAGKCPEHGEMHVFDTMEKCQISRAEYIDTHPSDPDKWAISRCAAKEVK